MATRNIIGLPPELLVFEILSDPSLTNQDRKNVRLTCRSLEPSATAVVFQRIFISRLKADRDAFLRVATTPHLAANVREVVWYELGCDGRAFRNMTGTYWGGGGEHDDEAQSLAAHLTDATANLCWLPAPGPFSAADDGSIPQGGAEHHDEMTPLKHRLIVQAFQGAFTECVKGMPRLDTFASVPMPSDRKIVLAGAAGGSYDADVGLMRTHAVDSPPDARTSLPGKTPVVYRDEALNEGLSRFLLPAMRAAPGKIARLRWLEEPRGPSRAYELARPAPAAPAALAHLTSVDLSVNASWISPGFPFAETVAALEAALRSAPRLREIRLAFDCAPGRVQCLSRPRLPARFMAGGAGAGGAPRTVWRDLRCLGVANVDLADVWLLPLVRAHAATLRGLHLRHCSFAGPIAEELSRVERLALRSLSVFWDRAAIWQVPGPVVVGGGEPSPPPPPPRRVGDGAVFCRSASEVTRFLGQDRVPFEVEALSDSSYEASVSHTDDSDSGTDSGSDLDSIDSE